MELLEREDIQILHPGGSYLWSTPPHRLVACQIIGNNAFDTGRFALDRAEEGPVDTPMDGVLVEEAYYFLVDGASDPYPIVPGFQDWEFPHGRIPDFWPQTITGTPVTPPLCGVTNCSYAAEEAHLVPKTEVLWYQRNKMERYGQDLRDINDVANVTHMRSDLHKSFDDHQFVIVPKVDDAGPVSSPTGSQYATHIVWKKAAELWPTHHDILVQNLPQISCPYLFARFAWTVLFQARPFLIRGISRHVIRVSASEDDKLERNAEFLTGPQLMRFYGGGGSEAAAPMRKRVKGGWARR